MRNFYKHLFYRTPLGDCSWIKERLSFSGVTAKDVAAILLEPREKFHITSEAISFISEKFSRVLETDRTQFFSTSIMEVFSENASKNVEARSPLLVNYNFDITFSVFNK